MGSRTGAAIALILLASCGGIERTETTSAPTVVSSPEPVAATSPGPQTIVQQPDGPGYECSFENDGVFLIRNLTDIGQQYTVYTTNFDHQIAYLWFVTSPTIRPGAGWSGQPPESERRCRQMDVSQFGPGGHVLKNCFAFYDSNGRTFNPSSNPERVTKCRTPQPTPTPECNRNTSSVITYSEWGSCIMPPVGEACYQTRTKTITSQCEQTKVLTETRYCHCPY